MNTKKTLIKICGLTQQADISAVNAADIDFAGFVLFFEKSKRNNTPEHAAELLKQLSEGIKKVAVVVSPSLQHIQTIEELGFDYIQIHGQLSAELLPKIHIPVLKAFNVKDIEQFAYYETQKQVKGFVFDASEPGSGKTFDWSILKKLPKSEKMLLLAGGLHAANVGEAIRNVHPDGVDVSSGVEYSDRPGKDFQKIIQFVHSVRSC